MAKKKKAKKSLYDRITQTPASMAKSQDKSKKSKKLKKMQDGFKGMGLGSAKKKKKTKRA